MPLNQLISPDRIACKLDIHSKKRALEQLAKLLTLGHGQASEAQVYEKLLERERLGSTALGHGVAIPHCRITTLEHERIAFISTQTPIDFDAVDKKPVDLLLAIIVPEHCTEGHLKILASAAEMFGNSQFCDLLRSAQTAQNLYELIANWKRDSLSA